MSNFKIFMKWARNFRRTHTGETLRRVWDGLGHRLNYLRECEGCSGSGVLNSSNTRQNINRKDGLFCRNCHVCSQCCDCVRCSRCEYHKRADEYCTDCQQCNKCCRCVSCPNCGEFCGEAYCERCVRCDGC